MRSRETCLWYSRHSGQRSRGSWTRSPVVVATHWAGGENRRAMLLGNASHGSLRKKGTNGNEKRANEPPSSYQNGDEPYPRGTWARQRVLLRICDAQTGTGNEWAGGHGYQTWCRWWQGLQCRWCGNGKRESWVRDNQKLNEYEIKSQRVCGHRQHPETMETIYMCDPDRCVPAEPTITWSRCGKSTLVCFNYVH